MDVTVNRQPDWKAAIVLADRGIAVPLPATFEVRDPALPGIVITGSLGADPVNLTVTVDQLCLHREPEGPTIGREHLRRVSVPNILEAAISQLGVPWQPETGYVTREQVAALTSADVANLRGKTRGQPTDPDLLAAVARVYNAAPVAPTKAVASAFDWSRATASRRISEARDAGLIEGTDNA